MDTIIKTQIIDLIHREVIPAIGCTEPIAVALAAAKAAEVLGRKPEKIEVYLSANILKNAMGVGIPGTGMVGLPIAIALGSIIGKSAYGLEVLKDLTPEGLKEGKEMVCKKCIGIDLKENPLSNFFRMDHLLFSLMLLLSSCAKEARTASIISPSPDRVFLRA